MLALREDLHVKPYAKRHMKVYADNIPAEDRIGVVRIGDAAVAYKTSWLADPLDYATSDADRAEAWAFFPTGC